MMHTTARKHAVRVAVLVCVLGMLAGGCDWRPYTEFGIPAQGDQTYSELNPSYDMAEQPAIKAQEEVYFDENGRAELFLPAAGTVPHNYRMYPEDAAADKAAATALGNPVPITRNSMNRGRDMYMTYCVTCHGERGLGNGYIVGEGKFSRPPSLTSRKLRTKSTDGDIYHIISRGQNLMPSYKNQLTPMERWAVVNYVRALQRAEHPTDADVKRAALPAAK
jgi:mono/diheme cytochrome c family protein